MNIKDKEKLTKHIERNRVLTEITMFGRTVDVEVVPSDRLLDYIEKLTSPVKVPKFMVNWYEGIFADQFNLEKQKLDGNDIFRIIQDVIKVSNGESTWDDWAIDKTVSDYASEHEETFLSLLINCSYQNGYEVEEEPKWVVRIGKVYLTGNQSYSFAKEDATPFEIEKFALEAAEKTGGEIEKV
ncbi:hypothetical protein [Enterococcus sp. AZ007]|uniref:hypothetical protein n=1 Tax=Enterococcus sp. AZ007 TaxID=2774839 RepID=UPI003F23578B